MNSYNVFILLLFPFVLSGCGNAITYHHSERNSIALETKATEPQQPVQGNIGVKTRTVVVSPKIEKNSNGESSSFISDFRFKRIDDENNIIFNKTIIKSAFITGDAAKSSPTESAKALSGLGYGAINDVSALNNSLLTKIYENLVSRKTDDKIAEKYVQQLDELFKLIPKNVSESIYYEIDNKELKEKKGDDLRNAFWGVLDYDQLLSSSLKNIDDTLKRNINKFNGKEIGEEQVKVILSEQKRLKEERDNYFSLIGNSHVIDAAVAYVTSYL